MSPRATRTASMSAALALLIASGLPALAQKKYDTGASDTEIKLGNIAAYSGPASAYGVIGKIQQAYFKKINEEGGINGRKITYISYDDAFSPPKSVEQTRKLVESDEVLFIASPVGTAPSSAIRKYLNVKKVPQIFVDSGATKWADPENFPWTIGFLPSYQSEGRIYANYLMKEKPDAKIAVLYQNDDFGKDLLKGLVDGYGDKAAKSVILQEAYEMTEPTIDSHIVKMKSFNPDVIMIFATPKFAAQAIKKIGELGWKPTQIVANVSASIGTVMKPAGFEHGQGLLSAAYSKDSVDPQWKDDPAIKDYHAFLAKYAPDINLSDNSAMSGYNIAQALEILLRQCGDDLTRANVIKQAANLKDVKIGTLLPGVVINTSPTDFSPIEQLQMMRFKGENWVLFGDVLNGESGATGALTKN